MNRLIPGKTKVKVELFRGVTIGDIVIAVFGLALIMLILLSSMPAKLWFCLGVIAVCAILLIRLDTAPAYQYLMGVIAHFAYKRHYKRMNDDAILMERAKNNGTQVMIDRMFTEEDGAKGRKRKLSRAEKKEKKQAEKAEKLAKKKIADTSAEPKKKVSLKSSKTTKKSKAERAEDRKAEKERKLEDALLNDKKTPQDIKDAQDEYQRKKK